MRSTFLVLGVVVLVAAVDPRRLPGSPGPRLHRTDPAQLQSSLLGELDRSILGGRGGARSETAAAFRGRQVHRERPGHDIGDGFWKTAEGLGNYTHYFADPEFGQVVFMGTMREAGAALLVSLRLRVELGRITEIEGVYFKPGGGGPNNIADMDKPYKPEESGSSRFLPRSGRHARS